MPSNPSQTMSSVRAGGSYGSDTGSLQTKQPVEDLMAYWKQYAKERPEVCAMWCFGIGFVLGWKLKPW